MQVLGNIYRPRRRFKMTALITVGSISLLYLFLNLCYVSANQLRYNSLINADRYCSTVLFPSSTKSQKILA
jgi:hypothetical protein